MDTAYMAAILTPVCATLIQRIEAPWLDPILAPPVLMRAGDMGKLYLLASSIVSIGSFISLIGLMVWGTASVLYTIGSLCIGFVCGGACLAMFGRSYWLNNLIAHALLVLNLIAVHWIAWASVRT